MTSTLHVHEATVHLHQRFHIVLTQTGRAVSTKVITV